MPTTDWKRFQFITTVQAAVINHAAGVGETVGRVPGAIDTLNIMHDAFDSVERIPEALSASDAAVLFCTHHLELNGVRSGSGQVPRWMAQGVRSVYCNAGIAWPR